MTAQDFEETNDPTPNVGEPLAVAEGVEVFASEDGRVFVDVAKFTAAYHMVSHMTGELIALVRGEEYAQGQHDTLALLHEVSETDYRELCGLEPHLPPSEDNEAPSDTDEAVSEIDELEEIFALLSPVGDETPDA